MIPSLTEMSGTPGPAASPPPPTGARSERAGAGLDFAGLLDAALPTEVSLAPEGALPGLPVPVPVERAQLLALPAWTPLPEPAVAAPLPPGTIPPQPGMDLPPSGADVPPALFPVMVATLPIMPNTAASDPPIPGETPAPQDGPDAAEMGETADTPQPGAVVLAAMAAQLPLPNAPAPGDPARYPAVPAPPVIPHAPAALRSAAAPRALAASWDGLPQDAPDGSASDALLADAEPSLQPAAPVTPGSPAPQPAATALAQAAPTAATAPGTERPEPRAPASQVESAIAQVGDIREALRASRPEMTLRHAEFGMVSLRIEAAGAAQDWRAVLASRDPGFVPAIQAALAERAVPAAAETASTGTGGQGSSLSDQRYGSSPGSGQGSSQPYLAQSGQREDGASQHQRHQQHRADEAASAGAPENDRPDRRERGLFA